jgi:hypothetical protein
MLTRPDIIKSLRFLHHVGSDAITQLRTRSVVHFHRGISTLHRSPAPQHATHPGPACRA